MTNPTPTPKQNTQEKLPSPLQCLIAAVISGGLALALYLLTSSIAQSFANKPLTSTNTTAIRISAVVRTMVVGMSTLATVVFSIVAVGLLALAIQLLIEQWRRNTSSSDSQ